MALKPKQQHFIDLLRAEYGANLRIVTRQQVKETAEQNSHPWPSWLTGNKAYRIDRGVFDLTLIPGIEIDGSPSTPATHRTDEVDPSPEAVAAAAAAPGPTLIESGAATSAATTTPFQNSIGQQRLIPQKETWFVPWGHFRDIAEVLKSRLFFPTFITGLSGNGKTLMVEQACAKQRREMIRVNITKETDEDDLLGGFRLIDGQTVFVYGPVIEAMERGAILLLDEVDLGSTNIMCLQPVLEGKGIFLKKVGRYVKPQPGFSVMATANTKGKGNDDGRFVGTNVLNEAFLDRFPITIEQPYASTATEKKILRKHMEVLGVVDEDFIDKLVQWSGDIRKLFADDGCDEIISTRRLIHIVTAFAIFRDRMKSISLTLSRFDEETSRSFKEFYTKIDAEVDAANSPDATATPAPAAATSSSSTDIPF